MINSGRAIYINPPTTIPINITGKKITVQSNFMIPQDAFKPNIKNFTINQSIQIVNNIDNIFFLLLILIFIYPNVLSSHHTLYHKSIVLSGFLQHLHSCKQTFFLFLLVHMLHPDSDTHKMHVEMCLSSAKTDIL